MLINTDLSPDTAALARPQTPTRPDSGGTAAAGQTSGSASQLDASLERLTGTPAGVQDAEWEIQDEAGAEQATSFASQSILNEPGTALTSQANQ